MARRDRSFSDGGTWKRPRQDGRGHSKSELQDRASYDQQPKSCTAALLVSLALWALVITTAMHLIGAHS